MPFLYVLSRGDDYKNHVKCISEDQKYGGKSYEAKANKGDVKQQQWIQVNGSDTSFSRCQYREFSAPLTVPLYSESPRCYEQTWSQRKAKGCAQTS